MGALAGTEWPWVVLVAVAVGVLVLLGLLVRYRALERRGSGLPPGTGGARLVGMTAVVTDPSGPGGPARVHVLGEHWRVVRDEGDLAVGDRVVITAVEGTRVVVEPAAAAHDRDDVEGVR